MIFCYCIGIKTCIIFNPEVYLFLLILKEMITVSRVPEGVMGSSRSA